MNTAIAAMRALDWLREMAAPDWYVLLSGSDYPVMKGDEVRRELATSPFDAYLDHREISYRALWMNRLLRRNRAVSNASSFHRPSWIHLAYGRYGTSRIHTPFPLTIAHPTLARLVEPKRPRQIFGGVFWFQARAKAIDHLLDSPERETATEYFKERLIPEEALIHTLLCRAPTLRISRDHKRFEDWSEGGPHPRWLDERDLQAIRNSGAHFARKLRPDGKLQDVIDRSLLGFSA